jgi:hypothetical protein
MKKSFVIKIIILIAAVLLNIQTIKSLHAEQAKINTDRQTMSQLPLASFHKFWADIKWMLFIQYMGSIDLTTDKNSETMYNDVVDIVSLDPSFYKVYEISSHMLSSRTPDLAINILEKGQAGQKTKKDPRLFTLAGNIRYNETFFNKEVNKLEKIRAAIEYFKQALKLPNASPILTKTYIKIKARFRVEKSKQAIKDATPEDIKAGNMKEANIMIAELNEWFMYINELSAMEGMENIEGMEGMEGIDPMTMTDQKTKDTMLTLIQMIRNDVSTRDDKEGKKLSQQLLQSMFKGIHICGSCYKTYSAGHKFCTACQKSVHIFGVCHNANCRQIHSNGKFCEFCGTPTKK